MWQNGGQTQWSGRYGKALRLLRQQPFEAPRDAGVASEAASELLKSAVPCVFGAPSTVHPLVCPVPAARGPGLKGLSETPLPDNESETPSFPWTSRLACGFHW